MPPAALPASARPVAPPGSRFPGAWRWCSPEQTGLALRPAGRTSGLPLSGRVVVVFAVTDDDCGLL